MTNTKHIEPNTTQDVQSVGSVGDYISRQAAIEETWKEPTYSDPINVLTEMRDRINEISSADVVEVVRCTDCVHNVANWQHDELDETNYDDIVCDYFMTDGINPTDFCSYGERRC